MLPIHPSVIHQISIPYMYTAVRTLHDQSWPFSAFHCLRYLSPLSAPFGSPSNRPLTDLTFFVTNGVSYNTSISHGNVSQLFFLTHLEVLQVLGAHVCSYFVPINHVSSMLCVTTRRSRSSSLVVSLVDLLRSERKACESARQRLSWLHDCVEMWMICIVVFLQMSNISNEFPWSSYMGFRCGR